MSSTRVWPGITRSPSRYVWVSSSKTNFSFVISALFQSGRLRKDAMRNSTRDIRTTSGFSRRARAMGGCSEGSAKLNASSEMTSESAACWSSRSALDRFEDSDELRAPDGFDAVHVELLLEEGSDLLNFPSRSDRAVEDSRLFGWIDHRIVGDRSLRDLRLRHGGIAGWRRLPRRFLYGRGILYVFRRDFDGGLDRFRILRLWRVGIDLEAMQCWQE